MKLKEKFGLTLAIALLVGAGISAKALRPDDDEKKPQKAAEKAPETSVVDEVVWVVGDEPILKSDVEVMRLQGEAEGVKYSGNPDCLIPEQIAVQKLSFLHRCSRAAALKACHAFAKAAAAGSGKEDDFLA